VRATDRFFVRGVYCTIHGRRMPVADLSVGGFFVACDDPPLAQPLLELELELSERPPFRLLGQVAWVNAGGERRARDLPAGFGVKIARIAFPDKLAIVDLLKRTRFPVRPTDGPQQGRKPPLVN
jgi:hypothetical protein